MTAARKEVLADGVELWLGDCREVLPLLGPVDLVLTDPPYGVGFAEWDELPIQDWLPAARALAPTVLVTTGIKNAFQWAAPSWIASYSFPKGDKRAVGGGINAWEPVLVYGKNTLPLDSKQFAPIASEKIDWHPCPKPLAPFKWLVRTATEPGALVLDPFLGSGTTGVAAVTLGRHFIGVELDPDYFDRACKRIATAMKQPDFFINTPAPLKQEALFK
jgi:site-specific DNA-methyltransferase (adenine-specific)